MMKIHTTQNLSALYQQQSPTNSSVSIEEFRLNKQQYNAALQEPPHDEIAFGRLFGKGKPKLKDGKKVINEVKKIVGDIQESPKTEKSKFIEGRLFNWILKNHKYEPVISAGAAAIICMLLRPATIMALPAKGKSKEDNIYAASHSIASGLMGLITAILITTPFRKSGSYVLSKEMQKEFKPEVLKRLYPHLNIESIWLDKAKGIKKPMNEWLANDGLKFISCIDKVEFLTEFKKLADTSDKTYKKILNLDIDWLSQKGKSFNDVNLKDGSALYDKISMDHLGIVVNEGTGIFNNGKERVNNIQILLKDLDRDFLEKMVEDSKSTGSAWGKLDVNSVYDSAGNVVDFRKWRGSDGKKWHLDLDTVYINSPIEDTSRRPRISGKKRYDVKDKTYKYVAYFDNGVNGKLGTEITPEIAEAALRNEGQEKVLTWLPDIITRVPVATATVALIPLTLKKVFGLEKGKNKPAPVQEKQADAAQIPEETKEVSFKGKGKDPEKTSKIIQFIARIYGKPIMESPRIAKLSDKLNKIPGKLTEHMMTLGSFITSSMYVNRTLKNNELDSDRKRTLAINQALCFLIPTIAAYTINIAIHKRVKNFGYKVSNYMKHAIDMAKLEGKEPPEFTKNLEHANKGIRILSSIAIFALVYRYITPVVVTPIANTIGESYNAKRAAKKAAALQENN